MEDIQSALYAILGLIVFGAFAFSFDYWLQGILHKATSYSYLLFGVLSGIASYFIIRKNPVSIWFVPLIFNCVLIFGLLIDTDLAMLGGIVLGITGSVLGFVKGRKET
ncbi:MAG: hypothetical protein WCR01_14970 [Bacteroidota bacterium]